MIRFPMPDENDEQFVQKRLLLACVISAVAIAAYVYVANLNAPPKPPLRAQESVEEPGSRATSAESAEPGASGEPLAAEPAASGASSADGAAGVPAETSSGDPSQVKADDTEREIVVETDTFTVTFSNRGGVVTKWVLKDYDNAAGEPLDLVHAQGAKEFGNPFRLALPGGEPIAVLDNALFTVNRGIGVRRAPATVVFEYADAARSATKTFRFEPEGYLVEIESELRENGTPRAHMLTWNGGFGDTAQLNDHLNSSTFYYDRAGKELTRNLAGDVEEDGSVHTGSYSYAGIDDLFFAAAFLPADEGAELRLESRAVQVEVAGGDDKQPFAAMAIGGGEKNQLQAFIGPKKFLLVTGIRRELGEMIDFGTYLGVLAKPLFFMLVWTHDNVVGNYGWAIIFVTFVINLVLFPLKWKSSGSMKKMQALQPLVKQINDKHKGLKMNDPKKQQQNEEMMALYKKHGVNPMGGCLPMVIQLPFFISFYSVLTVAIEMRHAEWLWVADLSQPEQITIRVLPLAMVASQFWMQSMTPTPGGDATQMRLMKFMPLMMGFFFYGFSAGLVLYWLTSNLVGVGQQVLLNHLPSDPIEIEQPQKRRKKKKSS